MSEDWAKTTTKELKSQCDARDIENHGTKKELVKRREDYEKGEEREKIMPSILLSMMEEQCDAVLVTKADTGIRDDDVMIDDGKKAFRDILEKGQLEKGYDMVPLTVRNPARLSLASLSSKIKVLQSKVATLEAKNMSLTSDLASHKIQINSLQSQVGDLTLSLEAHALARHQFISTFKRDKFGGMTDADWKFIASGNNTAHGGDAIADARLYTGRQPRRDYTAYKELYGIQPQVVREFTHLEIISVLNTHASVCASQCDTGSKKFYRLFAEFVKLLQEANYDPGDLVGNSTPLSRAYLSFVSCRKSEVTGKVALDGARDESP
ncbi:hypothetical protein HOY82DRAFT_555483 [Tuber indicum]|nr:hypothetical protein HOY82DRAFT_555483 [Tuber indicum]